MKARIVELEEMAHARQWLCKHVPTAMNLHPAIAELLEAVFFVQCTLVYITRTNGTCHSESQSLDAVRVTRQKNM
jgi:hypothetical protein